MAAALAVLGVSRPAAAEITLLEKDGWTVYMNGRVQTFLSYADGAGKPRNVTDANCILVPATDDMGNPILDPNGMQLMEQSCQNVEVLGGLDGGAAAPEWPTGTNLGTTTDPGKVRELRIRTGFTGNVLGFGIKKKLSENAYVLAYSAVTVGIEAQGRRKYWFVQPDWRESYLSVVGPWGSVTAGRQLELFSRGATEITYLYGYRYGLGFPGAITDWTISAAGHVGFGVLGNGFGAGIAYATPVLAGAQLTIGAYDATMVPNSQFLSRTRWPRLESELTYTMEFPSGMFKLFANGGWQKYYDLQGSELNVSAYGAGYGGRVEVGPVRLGVAGHYGTGIGVDFSFQNAEATYFDKVSSRLVDPQNPKTRVTDGYYAHLQVAPVKTFDLMTGFGVTRVHQLPEDRDPTLWKDPMDTTLPSVGYITIKQQMGISGGVTYHVSDNLHLALEYFRAIYQWFKPVPTPPTAENPEQAFHVVNAGITYDF